ncbi:MAG: H-X9-DG-CTERM domain-containing protein [Acidobacteriota bacterium]
MATNETIEMDDLEPVGEVKGGTTIASVTDLTIDPFNSSTSSSSRHPSGINVCLSDGSVR